MIFNACNKSKATTAPQPSEKIAANNTIRFLENRIKQDPEDFIAHKKLASEYLQQMRETGDVTYLNLASRAAHASLEILPAKQNKGGLVALTQVEYSSHDFRKLFYYHSQKPVLTLGTMASFAKFALMRRFHKKFVKIISQPESVLKKPANS